MRYLCLILCNLCCILFSFSQIVNIERERFQTDTTGWKGNFDLGFSMGKQKKTYFIFSSVAHIQYKSKKHLYLLIGGLNILKTKDENINNSGFLHFRYNYKMKKNWIRWEAFTQVQFNKVNGIRTRFLLGTGPRFKLVNIQKFRTYLGTLYMYEHEVNSTKSIKLNEVRFSGYISFSFQPIKQFELISTTYFQPNIARNKDYRIATDNAIQFRLHKHLSYGITYLLNYDSSPPIGAVSNLTYLWTNLLKVDF